MYVLSYVKEMFFDKPSGDYTINKTRDDILKHMPTDKINYPKNLVLYFL